MNICFSVNDTYLRWHVGCTNVYRLAYCFLDCTIMSANKECVQKFDTNSETPTAIWSIHDTHVVTAAYNGLLEWWDVSNGKKIHTIDTCDYDDVTTFSSTAEERAAVHRGDAYWIDQEKMGDEEKQQMASILSKDAAMHEEEDTEEKAPVQIPSKSSQFKAKDGKYWADEVDSDDSGDESRVILPNTNMSNDNKNLISDKYNSVIQYLLETGNMAPEKEKGLNATYYELSFLCEGGIIICRVDNPYINQNLYNREDAWYNKVSRTEPPKKTRRRMNRYGNGHAPDHVSYDKQEEIDHRNLSLHLFETTYKQTQASSFLPSQHMCYIGSMASEECQLCCEGCGKCIPPALHFNEQFSFVSPLITGPPLSKEEIKAENTKRLSSMQAISSARKIILKLNDFDYGTRTKLINLSKKIDVEQSIIQRGRTTPIAMRAAYDSVIDLYNQMEKIKNDYEQAEAAKPARLLIFKDFGEITKMIGKYKKSARQCRPQFLTHEGEAVLTKTNLFVMDTEYKIVVFKQQVAEEKSIEGMREIMEKVDTHLREFKIQIREAGAIIEKALQQQTQLREMKQQGNQVLQYVAGIDASLPYSTSIDDEEEELISVSKEIIASIRAIGATLQGCEQLLPAQKLIQDLKKLYEDFQENAILRGWMKPEEISEHQEDTSRFLKGNKLKEKNKKIDSLNTEKAAKRAQNDANFEQNNLQNSEGTLSRNNEQKNKNLWSKSNSLWKIDFLNYSQSTGVTCRSIAKSEYDSPGFLSDEYDLISDETQKRSSNLRRYVIRFQSRTIGGVKMFTDRFTQKEEFSTILQSKDWMPYIFSIPAEQVEMDAYEAALEKIDEGIRSSHMARVNLFRYIHSFGHGYVKKEGLDADGKDRHVPWASAQMHDTSVLMMRAIEHACFSHSGKYIAVARWDSRCMVFKVGFICTV